MAIETPENVVSEEVKRDIAQKFSPDCASRIDTYVSDVPMVNTFFARSKPRRISACIFARVKDERSTLRLVGW